MYIDIYCTLHTFFFDCYMFVEENKLSEKY